MNNKLVSMTFGGELKTLAEWNADKPIADEAQKPEVVKSKPKTKRKPKG